MWYLCGQVRARFGLAQGVPVLTSMLRLLNGAVLRNLNIYSFQKLYPVSSATWLSDDLKPKEYEVCWPMGRVPTGRAPHQLTESPFKYLNFGVCLFLTGIREVAEPSDTSTANGFLSKPPKRHFWANFRVIYGRYP